jgi:hypothetical protein
LVREINQFYGLIISLSKETYFQWNVLFLFTPKTIQIGKIIQYYPSEQKNTLQDPYQYTKGTIA